MENLPDGWPEMYSAAGRSPSCPHQMQWDTEDEVYRCIYDCGETDTEPPDSKVTETAELFYRLISNQLE